MGIGSASESHAQPAAECRHGSAEARRYGVGRRDRDRLKKNLEVLSEEMRDGFRGIGEKIETLNHIADRIAEEIGAEVADGEAVTQATLLIQLREDVDGLSKRMKDARREKKSVW